MPELSEYEVTQYGVTSTMQLTEEDAERLGGKKIGPARNVQTANDEGDGADPEPDAGEGAKTVTRATVQNRARRTG